MTSPECHEELWEDEVSQGWHEAATKLAGEEVGHSIAQAAGDDVTHHIDLAVTSVVLTWPGVLSEQIDHKLRVLYKLPEHCREGCYQKPQARIDSYSNTQFNYCLQNGL